MYICIYMHSNSPEVAFSFQPHYLYKSRLHRSDKFIVNRRIISRKYKMKPVPFPHHISNPVEVFFCFRETLNRIFQIDIVGAYAGF